MSYPRVADKPNFSEIEREVLSYWADDGTFEASVKARSGARNMCFTMGRRLPMVCPTTGTS